MLQKLILPNYQLQVNPKLKYIHLSLNERGELIVKSPQQNILKIEQLLIDKLSWIQKAQKRFLTKKGKLPTFQNKREFLYYLGHPYPITTIKVNSQKSVYCTFTKETGFTIHYQEANLDAFNQAINEFYTTQAHTIVTPQIKQQAKVMSVHPTAISFRKTKRQWGSCSAKNRLSFHTHIMKLPQDVIQYIIVHELAHIRHKHHQKAFWQEVEYYSPNYKECEQQLKEYLT